MCPSTWVNGQRISIHAPREGCDWISDCSRLLTSPISIHAPREGCDPPCLIDPVQVNGFQSTHPARGATGNRIGIRYHLLISIHAPREGCDKHPIRAGQGIPQISIHAPREGCDHPLDSIYDSAKISIHAPREGCDRLASLSRSMQNHFNPRTPRGVRQQTLPKSREFAWLNLLICTRGRRLSIQKQTRLCSIKLSFMLFGCEPAGEGVSSWTSHATKSKVRLEGRSA